MPLFTRQFVKDILYIIVFGTLLYTLTHNPITNPKLPETKGFWSIQLIQRPLVLGIAGHNYLALRDNNNRVVKELQGLATDNFTNTWKFVGNSSSDKLKVWEFEGSHYQVAQKNTTGIILFKGTKEEAVDVWTKGLICKEDINTRNIPYPPYGFKLNGSTENSNSVAYTLTLCMGLDAQHIGLITPGWGKNLLEGN